METRPKPRERALIWRGPGRYLEAYGHHLTVGDEAPFNKEEIAALEAQGLRFETVYADTAEPEADSGEGRHVPDEKQKEE